MEGLSKSLLSRLVKRPAGEWRQSELLAVLTGMGASIRENPPIMLEIQVIVRGKHLALNAVQNLAPVLLSVNLMQVLMRDMVVLHKMFDQADTEKGGKLRDFISSLQKSGDSLISSCLGDRSLEDLQESLEINNTDKTTK